MRPNGRVRSFCCHYLEVLLNSLFSYGRRLEEARFYTYCSAVDLQTRDISTAILICSVTPRAGMMECVYSCRHPLWGGLGSCLEHHPVLGTTCFCDDDGHFSPVDSLGNPSCVLKSALMALFLTTAAIELSLTAILAWDLWRHCNLPLSSRHGKRAAIWQRLTIVSM